MMRVVRPLHTSRLVAVVALACGKTSAPPTAVEVAPARAAPQSIESAPALPPLGAPGAMLWARRYGAKDDVWGWSLAIDDGDRLAIVGEYDNAIDFGAFHLEPSTKPQYGTAHTLYVAWLDASGTPVAARAYGDPGTLGRAAIVAAPDGDWIVAGHFAGELDFGAGALQAAGTTSAFVARLAPNGVARWAKKYAGAIEQKILDVAVARSGEIVVVGTFRHGPLDFGTGPMQGHDLDDVFVAAIRPDGTTRWAKSYGDEWGQIAETVAIDAAGAIVLGGEVEGTMDVGAGPFGTPVDTKRGPRGHLAWVAKLDADGRGLWSRVLAGDGQSVTRDVAIGRGGDVVVSGLFVRELRAGGVRISGAGNTDGFVVDLDRAGVPRWGARAGTPDNRDLEQAGNVAVDRAGTVALFGSRTGSDEHGGPVYGSWLGSFDANGAPRFVRSHPHALGDFGGQTMVLDRAGRAVVLGTLTQSIDLGTGRLDGDPRRTSVFVAAFVP